MLKRVIFFMLVVGAFPFIPFTSMGQPADPCLDPNFPDCPIDNNIAVLVIAAAGIAAKKGYDHKKKMRTAALS